MTERSDFIARIRSRLEGVEKTDVVVPGDWAPEITEPLQRFEVELIGAGGRFHFATGSAASQIVKDIVSGPDHPKVLVTREPGVPDVEEAVAAAGGRVLWWPDAGRDGAADADVGISGAEWAVAETGTILVSSAPPGGRSPSLLPPVHIAFVSAGRILRTVADLFAEISKMPGRPSNLVLITGPSKTGDIENELVTGVHGPGELHVVVVNDDDRRHRH